MLQWQSPPKLNIPSDLLDLVQGNAVLAQLLVQRGLATVDQVRGFLDADHYRPAPPDVLPDVDRAVVRLSRAINQREPIWVWGDFDADGQTSTTLLVSALRQLGGFVRYYIPNRMTESHGIKLPALERVLAQRAGLILTCDTGIAEHEGKDNLIAYRAKKTLEKVRFERMQARIAATDDPAALSAIVKTSKDRLHAKAALARIHDPAVLRDLVLDHDVPESRRLAAIERLNDEPSGETR